MFKQSSDFSFSADIMAHIGEAVNNLMTFDVGTVTSVDTTNHWVDVDIDVYDESNRIVSKLPVKKVPYLVNTIQITDSHGDTATVDSYIPKVNDKVLIAYAAKSFNRVYVVGKIGA
jgi:hypothetical protein